MSFLQKIHQHLKLIIKKYSDVFFRQFIALKMSSKSVAITWEVLSGLLTRSDGKLPYLIKKGTNLFVTGL
mgnify:CR=1 FL=1